MEKCYYSVKEFAILLNVCEHTVRNAIKAKRILAVRFGGGKQSPYRIHYSQLEKLIDEEQLQEEE